MNTIKLFPELTIHNKTGNIKKISGALGASAAVLLAEMASNMDKLLVVITTDVLAAARLEEELSFFLQEQLPIVHFPDWETLPFDSFSPHKDIISQRLTALYNLPAMQRGIFIVPISTALYQLCPQDYVLQNALLLCKGDKLDLTKMRTILQAAGYQCVAQVLEHGEFAIRGSILDLFPMGSEQPYRIDIFADEIDSIRHFDPETQRSTTQIDNIRLLPAREFGVDDASITYFRTRWREQFPGDLKNSAMYQDVSQGIIAPGLEYFLALFFPQLAKIFDYLPQESVLVTLGNIEQAGQEFWQEINQRHEQYCHDVTRPLLKPEQLFIPVNDFFQQLKRYIRYDLNLTKLHGNTSDGVACAEDSITAATGDQCRQNNLAVEPLPDLVMDVKASLPLQKLQDLLATVNNTENSKEAIPKTDYFSSKRQTFEFLGVHTKCMTGASESSQQLQKMAGEGWRVLLCAETAGRREALRELLQKHYISPDLVETWRDFLHGEQYLGLAIAPLTAGMILIEQQIIIIAEADLLGQKVTQVGKKKIKTLPPDVLIRNLAELNIGTAVVHSEHGVGRYLGLTHLTVGGVEAEFVTLEYAGGDKLYVPVAELQLISRYSSADLENAPLHQLGNSGRWQREKRKALEQVRDTAAELLAIYAKREHSKGLSYPEPDLEYNKFVAGFPFEETTEQAQAILDVIKDLTAAKPMDSVVCGDVGFGKTEVALRAAFLVLEAGKQVAVMVPTTLLAQQHYQTCIDRFVGFPFQIEVLSRFKSAAEQKAIITKLQAGLVDLVIGTHKLLQEDIKFNNLGLLIIDEEHRFGVRQKEKFKALRAEVDILTLTATPIPRTLNMAMASIRDLSIISTPPAKRLSIKTFVREYNTVIIAEAVLREIRRGGQIYYLHNEVKTINNTAVKLQELVPNARIAVAHGQMHEHELEQIMSDFYHRRFNILVCTTIIETGIDVPTANTIIIERADKFGLAQLHQLRGRVGRSHHQAYAFCLTPNPKAMTKDAIKRLEALESLETLGAGFMLATHDLEIRGAGELLGDAQSGNIQAIGFSMYMELLEQAVKTLQSGQPLDLEFRQDKKVEIDLQVPALIPEAYVPDVQMRLVLYKRIAGASDSTQLAELKIELIDRFGELPLQAKYLFKIAAFKLTCEQLGINKIKIGVATGRIDFDTNPNVDLARIIKLVQESPRSYQFAGSTSIKVHKELIDRDARLDFVEQFLDRIQ